MNPKEKGKVLVTGGAGFLGSRIVRRLLSLKLEVVVFDSQAGPFDAEFFGPEPLPGRFSHIQGSVLDSEAVGSAMEGVTSVFHCAAEKIRTARMEEVNVEGTRIVFEAARASRVTFFCLLSSVGVTGKTDAKVVDEQMPCHPMTVYEETKLKAEEIVAKGIDGARTLVLRPTNLFGEEFVRHFLTAGWPFRLKYWIKGRERAHLVYVEDAAAVAVFFLQHLPSARCETFIVSSDAEAGNTFRGVRATLRSLQEHRSIPIKGLQPPIQLPWLLRRFRHGETNLGDIVYSSHRLFSTGFRMPFGLKQGLADALARLEAKGSIG
ncbi:MAG: NAD(P)-dependent oxidoreductase [Planctomycetota bacterium]